MNNNNYRGYPQQNRMRQMNSRDTDRNDNCLLCCTYGDAERAAFPDYPALAMAYVPFQQWEDVYSCEKALSRGTLFPCLDKPFMMGCCK